MRETPTLLVAICLLIIVNLAHSDQTPDKSGIDKGEIVNVTPNIESKIIVGNGATVIISSTDKSFARVLTTEIDVSRGGVVRKLLNGRELQASMQSKGKEQEALLASTAALPTEFTIEKAYPNPFNPVVNVRFGLPTDAPVHIAIHDLSGRLINSYSVGSRTAGWHEFSWNATDQLGQLVGTGVYLLTIRAGELLQKQKLTYLK